MKKYLLGIIAVISAIGLSAFSPESKKVRKGLTTYYSVIAGTGPLTWTWETTVPMGFSCLTEDGGPTCSTVAGSKPDNNTAPSGFSDELHKE